ncbi:MAG: hypothetical protein QG657_5467, partial [Acidobacteriota bacterium]|nr:hypothetical protein [Acidobacteriota bacterium]
MSFEPRNETVVNPIAINPIAIAVFVVLIGIDVFLTTIGVLNTVGAAAWAVIATLMAVSIRIANQWEKAVILRMGKFVGLKGPGLFL